jgi:anti-sigma regulatory factor (Ser/Thr protein kinase)
MPESSLTIPPRTDHVRIARMVACAAARRLGLHDEEVDEVRLAVGEAVGRAVQRHTRAASEKPVTMRMVEEPPGLRVEVTDAALDAADEDSGLAMAVITGLVPDAHLSPAPGGGQVLSMSWAV